jgi:DNA-binding transcriptional regulator YiaG
MSGIITATVVTGVIASEAQSSAARRASRAQTASNDAALEQNQLQFEETMLWNREQHAANISLQRHIAGMQIGEQRRQFNMVQQVLSPYVNAGKQALEDLKPYQQAGLDALSGQRALIGLDGSDAQGQAIQGLANSPEMAAYIQQGENALLQNASATGGLRGGNTQAALGQFRPGLLAGMINQQYDRLGGLTGLGANTTGMVFQTGASAAAGQANAGMQVAGNIGNALSNYAGQAGSAYNNLAAGGSAAMGQMGAAYNQYYNNQGSINAGNALAQGQASAGMANAIGGALGSYAMLQTLKGGATSNPTNQSLYSLNAGGGGQGLQMGGGQGLRAF